MTLQRQIRITAGSNSIDYGRIAIDVPKTLDADPPEGKVTFTNLSIATENRFEEKQSVRVEAGQSRLQHVYTGQIIRVEKKIAKPNTSLTLYLTPYNAAKETELIETYANTTLFGLITTIIAAMGMPAGDLDAVPLDVQIEAWPWRGTAAGALNAITREYNLSWYIDEGRVNIASTVRINNQFEKMVINAANGMVGSPEKTDTGVKVKVLLDVPVALNQLVEVQSASYIFGYDEEGAIPDSRESRTYKVYGMHYRGDNWDGGSEYPRCWKP